jgi:hypothetical protein
VEKSKVCFSWSDGKQIRGRMDYKANDVIEIEGDRWIDWD